MVSPVAASSSTKPAGEKKDGGWHPRCVLGPFDVKMPPVKRHMVSGHLVPTLRTALFPKKRRVSIEIHAPSAATKSTTTTALPELQPWDPDTGVLNEQDLILVRVFRLSKDRGGSHDEDDDGGSVGTWDSASVADDDDDEEGKTWREHYRYLSDGFEIRNVHGKNMEVKLGAGNDVKIRDIKFESNDDAVRFQKLWESILNADKERTRRKISDFKVKQKAKSPPGGKMRPLQSPLTASEAIQEEEPTLDDDLDEEINLLVEIASGSNIPVGDISSSDAYVIVRLRDKEIHRTSVVHNSLSPIWTLDTGSLFLLQTTPEEFFAASSGMSFVLKDWDQIGSNETLGTVTVGLEELLEGTGERKGYEIVLPKQPKETKPEKDETKKKKSMLYLRYKRASQQDIDFMRDYSQKTKKFGMYSKETFLPIRMQSTKFLKRQVKKRPNRQELHRVRPGPDPDRLEDETKWMTSEEIEGEAFKPSTHWVQVGSGNIGRLFLELIGCDGLPNMDSTSLNINDKTDAFACMVFEDCIVNTDVIGDCLSPRWMPWTRRAFAFNISHPSSDLLLGLFDYDPELSPIQVLSRTTSDLHDPIGRLVVELSKFLPNTTYLLKYPLYYGELEEHRKKSRGTVIVRLRLEFPDLRKAMLRGLSSPPVNVVAVDRYIDYRVAKYTTDGVVDDSRFSVETLSRYVAELQGYLDLIDTLKDAVMVVWLWRGHHNVTLLGKQYKLPLHSMTAFTWGILVSWNTDRATSFWLFAIGWLMLSCNEAVRRHPSRWHKAPSYYEFLCRLVLNTALRDDIPPNQNEEEISAYEEKMQELRKRRAEEKKREEENELALQQQFGQDMEQAEKAEQIDADKGGFFGSVNPLKPILYPVQQNLHSVVQTVRIAKSIILWNEAYYAFWIVTICFVSSFVAFFIPWSFIFVWLFRIVVIVGLGPWMALVDRYYFKKHPTDMTDAERDEFVRKRLRSRYEEALLSATTFQIRRERAVKMQSMTKYMFGKHMLRVPLFHEDLFFDLPLSSSSANPDDINFPSSIKFNERLYGQHLRGDMIPEREVQTAHAKTPKPQPKKKRFWSRKNKTETVPLLDKPPKKYNSLS